MRDVRPRQFVRPDSNAHACRRQHPREKPRHITQFTSHLDVVPTVLTYMGAENPLTDYTQGQPLTLNKERRIFL